MSKLEDKLSASITPADGQKDDAGKKTVKKAAPGKGDAKKADTGKASKKDAPKASAKKKASGATRGRQSGHVQAGSLASRQVWPD